MYVCNHCTILSNFLDSFCNKYINSLNLQALLFTVQNDCSMTYGLNITDMCHYCCDPLFVTPDFIVPRSFEHISFCTSKLHSHYSPLWLSSSWWSRSWSQTQRSKGERNINNSKASEVYEARIRKPYIGRQIQQGKDTTRRQATISRRQRGDYSQFQLRLVSMATRVLRD